MLVQPGVLCSYIFGNALAGIVILHKQKRYGGSGQAYHQNRITVYVFFQPQWQHNHADHHADDDTGNQRPGHFSDVLYKCFFLGVTSYQRTDGIPEQIEICAAHGMIADYKKEEIEPIDVAHTVAGEQEYQAANDD